MKSEAVTINPTAKSIDSVLASLRFGSCKLVETEVEEQSGGSVQMWRLQYSIIRISKQCACSSHHVSSTRRGIVRVRIQYVHFRKDDPRRTPALARYSTVSTDTLWRKKKRKSKVT